VLREGFDRGLATINNPSPARPGARNPGRGTDLVGGLAIVLWPMTGRSLRKCRAGGFYQGQTRRLDMTHSALPYRIEPVGKTTYRTPDQDDYAIRAGGPSGVAVGIVFGGWSDGRGNGDLIVTAVNAHAALLEALKSCPCLGFTEPTLTAWWEDVAMPALALAEPQAVEPKGN